MSRIALTWLAAMAALSAFDGAGLGLGPALILVRDVPVGRPFSLGEVAQVRYQVYNNSNEEATYNLKAVVPSQYAFSGFEKGYEPAPDATWFRLDRELVTVPAQGRVEVDLTIDIPDRAELRNRHWIVSIEAGQPSQAAMGASLRLSARIMLETEVSAEPGGGEISLSPSVVIMQAQADGSWIGEARLRNNSTEAAQFDLLAAHEVFSAEPDKAHRYFANLNQAVLGERWAVADAASIQLAAGAERTVRFTVPARPAVTSLREEVLFVSRRLRGEPQPDLTVTVGGATYERMELLRLRYQPAAAVPAPAEPAAR